MCLTASDPWDEITYLSTWCDSLLPHSCNGTSPSVVSFQDWRFGLSQIDTVPTRLRALIPAFASPFIRIIVHCKSEGCCWESNKPIVQQVSMPDDLNFWMIILQEDTNQTITARTLRRDYRAKQMRLTWRSKNSIVNRSLQRILRFCQMLLKNLTRLKHSRKTHNNLSHRRTVFQTI